ncbi:MAG: anti-phage defense ZorAB system ZorA [Bdellovibrio sp.]|nr:anti-phage defense ZorAB system ZorA [Bdellovibrio sp.]
MQTLADNFSQYLHLWLVGGFLALSIIAFIARFWVPAVQLGFRIRRVVTALKSIRKAITNSISNLDQIAEVMAQDDTLKHLWSEYCETLHAQKTVNEMGQEKVSQYRSTAMAEVFFTEHSIVSTPLKTEFYKHLPGILTGLGIIGTFSGLINGLNVFASGDASMAQQNLKFLIGSVGHAFYVSAAAITLAMLCTWIEKFVVTARCREVEHLCHLIDSFFDAGAGEEYLERLVKASESSAVHSAHMKDALVSDLKKILSDLSTKELEAASVQTQMMTGALVESFTTSIQAPMAEISAAVNHVGSNQGDAVTRLLTDVLLNFSTQMKDMFGGQMTGLNSALQESIKAMQSTASRFDDLAGNLQGAGKSAADTMASQLEEAMKSAQARQELMNKQMGDFVEAIRGLVSNSQSETSKKTQEVLNALSEKVAETVKVLQIQAEGASQRQESREVKIAESTQGALKDSSQLLQTLTTEVAAASRAMNSSVSQLTNITQESIQKLNSGAETLYLAASEFSKAGDGVSGTLKTAAQVTSKMETASGNLASASSGVQGVFEDYKKTRETFALMVSDLKNTVENAKREALLTTQLVAKLQGGAEALGAAEKAAEEYLKGVTAVVAQVHQDFAANLSRTLTEGNGKFHSEVAQAANFLSGAIQQLGDTLDSVQIKMNKHE